MSMNEELNTLNTALQNKVVELEQRHHDVENLLASSGIAAMQRRNRYCSAEPVAQAFSELDLTSYRSLSSLHAPQRDATAVRPCCCCLPGSALSRCLQTDQLSA
jgi:hypothetical protein